MNILKSIVICMTLFVSQNVSAHVSLADSIDVNVCQIDDSMSISLVVYDMETQLTFLMQGLDVYVVQEDTLLFSFPSASMVRGKVKRHPNEVKAVLLTQGREQTGKDSVNNVVRPDVFPLVSALNDTTATIYYGKEQVQTHIFSIEVDRETAVMKFDFCVSNKHICTSSKMIEIELRSLPSSKGDSKEFNGKTLSAESTTRPDGLGAGIRKDDVFRRTIKKRLSVPVIAHDDYKIPN